MSISIDHPVVRLPHSFDERAEYEMTSRGYLAQSIVELPDGSQFEVYFIEPVRLAQTLGDEASAGRPFYAEPNMILVEEVTRASIEEAVRGLWESGFFTRLKPIRTASRPNLEIPEIHRKIASGLQAGNWSEVLELLKEHEPLLAPDRVALWRGCCYRGMGQDLTALIFFDEAARLNPG
jgi:hypothetical protein